MPFYGMSPGLRGTRDAFSRELSMCGIAGIFHYGGGRAVDLKVLAAMRDTMVHRGPDGEGLWISSDGRAGLAHRRLSIVDLQPAAAQPMSNEDGSCWVSFNGEIYNHLELREQLITCGHRFQTHHSDTEVLVHGYEQWGIDGLLKRLKGMFAFSLYDDAKAELFLVRDRVGIKPLYFSLLAETLLFASEIKALFEFPGLRPAMSKGAMYHYLSFLTTPAPMTMFQQVYKLPAGHYLRMSGKGKLEATRYWDALPGNGIDPAELKGLSDKAVEDFYIRGIRRRLEKSVERRMMADVPYGAFLSGGIDSTTNVALMSRFSERPIRTFTVGYSDHKYLNELDYARKAADCFRTEHEEVMIGESDMISYLDEMVYYQDEPIADWVCIPMYFVSKLARKHGVKVVQVGEGADEQFAGYQGYLDFLNLSERYCRPFRRFLPGAAQQALAGVASVLGGAFPSWGSKADIIRRAANGEETFWTGATLFWETQKRGLLKTGRWHTETVPEELLECGLLSASWLEEDSFEVIRNFRDNASRRAPAADELTRMIYNEFKLRLPELLLMRVDKITMSASLEARVPYLDHELVEFTMDIGSRWKIGNNSPKRLLKAAVRDLIPDEIIDRPKMGFGAPMKEWLRADFGREVKERLRTSSLLDEGDFNRARVDWLFTKHDRGKDMSSYIWALYNLSTWYARWIGK